MASEIAIALSSTKVIPGFRSKSQIYSLQQATLPGAVNYEQPRRQVRNPETRRHGIQHPIAMLWPVVDAAVMAISCMKTQFQYVIACAAAKQDARVEFEVWIFRRVVFDPLEGWDVYPV